MAAPSTLDFGAADLEEAGLEAEDEEEGLDFLLAGVDAFSSSLSAVASVVGSSKADRFW